MRLARTGLAVGVALAICAFAASADAAVFAGHSGWFWANPLPQGNTLRAIDFAGERGYAVGAFGTVVRTDDGGNGWTGLTTGTSAPLSVVRAVSADTIVAGGKCVVLRSDDGGQTFRLLPWTPIGAGCRAQVRSLAFPSGDIGYLVLSDGSVMRTRDGGADWSPRTAVPGTTAAAPGSTVHPTDVFFTANDSGFVTTEAGAIYRTTDGGTSWSPLATAHDRLDSITFADNRTGYAVGGATVMKTGDAGATWSQLGTDLATTGLDWIRCADALRCMVATTKGGQLLRTDDGGITWTSISPSSRELFATAYSASGTVVAVGAAGTTVISPDGGHNFGAVSSDLGGRFTRLRASSALVAYALGRAGALARTVDGGQDWTSLVPPVAGDLRDVSFPTIGIGFALDNRGTLMRTDDGGGSWHLLDIGTYLPPNALLALNPNDILLVGPRGVRGSINGGLDFTRVRQRSVATATLTGVGQVGRRLVFAYGRHAIVLSSDGGQTWNATRLPARGESVVTVDFVTDTIAYALTRDGRLWKTLDTGAHWSELPALGTEVGTDIAFSDFEDGYVAVSQFGADSAGYLMRTTDGGETWRPQLVDSARILPGALAAPETQTAYAIAGGEHVLATNSGGDLGERSSLELSIKRMRPGQPGVIAINGLLQPADGGETVVVSKREGRNSHWLFRDVTVSSSGKFTVFAKVTRTTSFVAQWAGDHDHVGAGSQVLTVGVGRKYRHPA